MKQPSSTNHTHKSNPAISIHDPFTEISTILSCPITWEPFIDPVLLAADGHTYERTALQKWFTQHYTSPITGQRLCSLSITPNHGIRTIALPWTKILAEQALAKKTRIHQDARILTLENVAREEREKRLALESQLNGMEAIVECKDFEIEELKRRIGQMEEIAGHLGVQVVADVNTKHGAVKYVNKMLHIKDELWYAFLVGLIEIFMTACFVVVLLLFPRARRQVTDVEED
ncbi:UNVERIFIED_CONTAM: hypothetical protein HDU68_009969 [Siphonaria sp. JEL0065]|nr:hypothetical protein HDU68_009969 [Siphonaria sp. JEL0065]